MDGSNAYAEGACRLIARNSIGSHILNGCVDRVSMSVHVVVWLF